MASHANQGYQGLQWVMCLGAGMAITLVLAGVVGAEPLSNQTSGVTQATTNLAAGSSNQSGSNEPHLHRAVAAAVRENGKDAEGLICGASNPAVCAATASDKSIDAFLDSNQERYRAALVRTRRWLDSLKVNPADLRAHSIKGKKKLAELLDVYLRLYDVAAADGKKALMARIRGITAVTVTPEYHDMLSVSDQQFKEDSTSYLRVAFLMDRFGLDTKLYRQEILKALPRLNDQMKYRGSDQRMAFHLYYQHFGLKEPFPLQAAYQTGVIASRHTLDWFKQNKMEIYNLTHEIFVPYEFGEKLDADFFAAPDKAYLRPMLADLTVYGIGLDDADITAELTSCLRYLHFTDLPVYRESIEYLLKSQRQEGKWGDYEQNRVYYGDYVNQAFYLHTTLVVVDALTTAFHYRER